MYPFSRFFFMTTLTLSPIVDPRLRVVALAVALQLRLYLRLVLFVPRAVRRHQRVAAYVFLAVVLHHAIYDLPPLLVRAAYGVDDLVLDMSNHPLRGGRVSERDITGYVRLHFEPRLRLVRRQPRLRVRVSNVRLASHLLEGLFKRGA